MKQPAPARRSRGKSALRKKSRAELDQEARDRKRQKRHRGNPSGSRGLVKIAQTAGNQNAKLRDPRTGSKKPVPLLPAGPVQSGIAPEKAERQAKTALSPQEELALLENDEQLDNLLNRLDKHEILSAPEQLWLDQTLDRIERLMEILGIEPDNEEDEEETKEDLYRLLKG